MRVRITARFGVKAGATVALVVMADRLFWAGGGFGSTLGLFAVVWTVGALLLTRRVGPNLGSRAAALFALLMAVVLWIAPGLLSLLLFWNALALMILLPRVGGFDHAGRWALRLVLHGFTSIVGPWQDLARLRRHVSGRAQMRRALPLLPLPLIGGALFLALFASANPLIGDALLRIGVPEISAETVFHGVFWGMVFTLVWASLRPRRNRIGLAAPSDAVAIELPGISVGSVQLALLTFNLLFALQNGLDLAYLWSGAALPPGMTLADYAHRGAYPLILTALLAGAFVLVALRPGTATAAMPAIRRMVALWIAQNVFLVASTILRTIDYIEVYSLTRLRIAALIWMALVAVGLVLILWRMLRGRSAAWLINANAGAALLVLTGCSAVDLGSIAAAWNVRHAREVGGKGAELDLCYLNQLGPSALVSIVELERRGGLTPDFAARVRWVRHEIVVATESGQMGGEWTWRNARRLAQVRAMAGNVPLPAADTGPHGRACDGSPLPPSPLTDGVPQ